MTAYAWAALITSALSLLFALFIYVKSPRRPAHVTLSLYSLAVAVWGFGHLMREMSAGPAEALFWSRFYHVAAIFIPILFLHFVYHFLGKIRRLPLLLAYYTGLLFLLLDLTPHLIQNVALRFGKSYYPVPGIFYPFYALFFFVLVAEGLYRLSQALTTSSGNRRNQIIYVFLASVIGFAGGATVFLPTFGINLYPFGMHFVSLYALLAGYAILKHRLMDIRLAVRRSIVYSVIIGSFMAGYFLLVIFLNQVFQSANSFALSLFIILAFAYFALPLQGRLQNLIDRIFFKDTYDYKKALRDLADNAVTILNLEEMTAVIIKSLARIFNLGEGYFFLRDNGKYLLRQSLGKTSEAAFDGSSFLAAYLQGTPRVLLAGELADADSQRELRERAIDLIIPIQGKDGLLGFIGLPEKRSLEGWTAEDISLLETLSRPLAVAIENASLHQEIIRVQKKIADSEKLSAIGAVAAYMAHEIKNPLAAMKGMTQVLEENIADRDFLSRFSQIIPRQIDRLNGLVENLLRTVRRTGAPEAEAIVGRVDLRQIIGDVLSLAEDECRRAGIEIVRESKNVSPILGNYEKCYQIINNVVLNAIQAMTSTSSVESAPGGKLKVEDILEGDKIVIRISDTGGGITEENLPLIFEPFFTTRENGAGLGLALVKKMLEEQEGTVKVESRPGFGTSFSLYFKGE